MRARSRAYGSRSRTSSATSSCAGRTDASKPTSSRTFGTPAGGLHCRTRRRYRRAAANLGRSPGPGRQIACGDTSRPPTISAQLMIAAACGTPRPIRTRPRRRKRRGRSTASAGSRVVAGGAELAEKLFALDSGHMSRPTSSLRQCRPGEPSVSRARKRSLDSRRDGRQSAPLHRAARRRRSAGRVREDLSGRKLCTRHCAKPSANDGLLILTHTNAACDVFADRTRGLSRRVEIRTIDGLIVEIAGTYHHAFGLPADVGAWARREPKTRYAILADWTIRLLTTHPMVAGCVAQRYPVIICDEHQDASADQYAIIMACIMPGHGSASSPIRCK